MPVYLLLLALIAYLLLWTSLLRRASVDIDEHRPAVTLSLSLCLSSVLFATLLLFSVSFSLVWALFFSCWDASSNALLAKPDASVYLWFKILFCLRCTGQSTTAFFWFINESHININGNSRTVIFIKLICIMDVEEMQQSCKRNRFQFLAWNWLEGTWNSVTLDTL